MPYCATDRLEVQPFTRQQDGEEVVIGRPDANVFLALPAEALEVLDSLAVGRTVGEACAAFASAHGVEPDVDDLLQYLEQKGFVRRRGEGAATAPVAGPAAGRRTAPMRYHFANIPVPVARRFFGPVAMTVYLGTIALALAVAAARPELIPGRSSLVFTEHRTAKLLTLVAVAYSTIFLHEFAHLLAARSRGVRSRIGIANRLWIVVAETDMTGLWAVPRRQRYLPVLAGPLLDSLSAAVLFLVLFVESRGAFTLAPAVNQLARAMIFVYMFRLLWQCYLFVRTDFYYVITTFFGCKNLMQDTQVFIYNLLRRAVGSKRLTDQSHIPPRERRVIRMYSVLWFMGRAVALFSLFFISIPVLLKYLEGAVHAVQKGYAQGHYQFLDALAVGVLNLAPMVVGLSLWVNSLVRRRRVA